MKTIITCWRTAARIPASTRRISLCIFCISGSTPDNDASVHTFQANSEPTHSSHTCVSLRKTSQFVHTNTYAKRDWEEKNLWGTSGWCIPERSTCPWRSSSSSSSSRFEWRIREIVERRRSENFGEWMLSQSELSFLSIIQWRWNWVDLRWGTLCEPGSTSTTFAPMLLWIMEQARSIAQNN